MNSDFLHTQFSHDFGIEACILDFYEHKMLGFLLYCGAVFAALLLFMFYRPSEEKEEHVVDPRFRISRKNQNDFAFRDVLARMGISCDRSPGHFEAFTDHFKSFEEVASACKRAGLEKCNLIIGVDFTASNEWQGRKTFSQNSLHKLAGSRIFNPYQRVIWIMGQTLASFDEDNLIPCFGFGDSVTMDENVFSFKDDTSPCLGFQEVLYYYNQLVPRLTLSGPTSFAPVIRAAIEIVKQEKKYHILVIIADGQVTEEQPTIDAIIDASNYPLSIIVVGVGDGPWCIMEEFDHRLPRRKFDNFRFVDYHKATSKSKNPDTSFALQALMEIPDQYKTMKYLGYIESNEPNEAKTPNKKPQNNLENLPRLSVKSRTFSCLEEEALRRKGSVKSLHRTGSYSRPSLEAVTEDFRPRTGSMKSLRASSRAKFDDDIIRRGSSALARILRKTDSSSSCGNVKVIASQGCDVNGKMNSRLNSNNTSSLHRVKSTSI